MLRPNQVCSSAASFRGGQRTNLGGQTRGHATIGQQPHKYAGDNQGQTWEISPGSPGSPAAVARAAVAYIMLVALAWQYMFW